jgi:hypothetical protein
MGKAVVIENDTGAVCKQQRIDGIRNEIIPKVQALRDLYLKNAKDLEKGGIEWSDDHARQIREIVRDLDVSCAGAIDATLKISLAKTSQTERNQSNMERGAKECSRFINELTEEAASLERELRDEELDGLIPEIWDQFDRGAELMHGLVSWFEDFKQLIKRAHLLDPEWQRMLST